MYKNFQFPFSTKALGITFERGGGQSHQKFSTKQKKKSDLQIMEIFIPGEGWQSALSITSILLFISILSLTCSKSERGVQLRDNLTFYIFNRNVCYEKNGGGTDPALVPLMQRAQNMHAASKILI